MDAFLDSCRGAGITPQENSWTADAAVIWSVLWHGRMAQNQEVYQRYRAMNKPVIVIDIGALYRGETWKIAVDNVNALGYYGHQTDLDWDRPRHLELSLGSTMPGTDSILIAAQHGASLQVESLESIESWIRSQVATLRQYTDRSIVIRPHPRYRLDLDRVGPGVSVELPHKISDTYDSFNLRFDYHAMVNYNSGPGIQAAIEGCPIIVDQTSLAHPISITHAEIEDPPSRDRDQWFVEICHTEYTLQEIRQGRWLKRLRDRLC